MKKLAVSAWTVLGRSAQNCDSFAGSEQFGSSSANPMDCETDSVSELTVAVPQKRPGASVCRHAGQYGI